MTAISPEIPATFQAALDDAMTAIRSAKPEQAVMICDSLLDAYPEAVRALRLRGQALEAMGDGVRAAQDYEKVLDISPTDTATALSYAKTLWRLGRKEEAALEAQHLLDVLPNDPDAQRIAAQAATLNVGDSPPPMGRLAAARAQFAVGRNQQALNGLRKLIAQSPDRLDTRLTLAEFLWQDGQRIQAADVCQQILDEQPDCLLAHALLAQVWRGADGLRAVHVRAVNEADPDHYETEALLGTHELFEVADVPAAPQLTGFADEDVRDTSDDPDHDDYLNRLSGVDLDVGPISEGVTVSRAEMVGDANGEDDGGGDGGGGDGDGGDDDGVGTIGSYSPLDWERGAAQAEAPTMAPVTGERAAWLKALEEKFASAPQDEADEAATPAMTNEVTREVAAEAAIQPLQWTPVEHVENAGVAEANAGDANSSIRGPAIPPSPQPKPARQPRPKPTRGDALAAARSAVQANTAEQAVEHYRKAIRTNKRVDEVLTDVMALAAAQPRREWFVLMGEAYTSKGNIEAALEAYRRAQDMYEG
jgi:tetratricopeptide (TPR) repeat protein